MARLRIHLAITNCHFKAKKRCVKFFHCSPKPDRSCDVWLSKSGLNTNLPDRFVNKSSSNEHICSGKTIICCVLCLDFGWIFTFSFLPPTQQRCCITQHPEEPSGIDPQHRQHHHTRPPALPTRHRQPQHLPRRPAERPAHGHIQWATGLAHALPWCHPSVTNPQPWNQQPFLQTHLQTYPQVGEEMSHGQTPRVGVSHSLSAFSDLNILICTFYQTVNESVCRLQFCSVLCYLLWLLSGQRPMSTMPVDLWR